MNSIVDILIIVVILTNFRLLGSSQLKTCVRVVAVQALILSILPVLAGQGEITLHLTIVALISGAIKGFLMPWLLMRAMREAHITREMEPIVGYVFSLICGIAMIGLSFWLSQQLPLPGTVANSMLLPLAIFTMISGLFMIVARGKAITQVVGYLMMENGIYAFGLTFAYTEPLIVEMGMLLDIFVAVFVMGIAIFNINREFDSIDTELLTQLKD